MTEDYHLKRGANGHLLRNADGHLVNECEENPCESCENAEPGATATVTGSCSGEHCQGAAGTYNFYYFSKVAGKCVWLVRQPDFPDYVGTWEMYIRYNKNTGVWDVCNYDGSGGGFCGFRNTDAEGISCVEGTLSGSFTLAGEDVYLGDCTGCTLNVTLT